MAKSRKKGIEGFLITVVGTLLVAIILAGVGKYVYLNAIPFSWKENAAEAALKKEWSNTLLSAVADRNSFSGVIGVEGQNFLLASFRDRRTQEIKIVGKQLSAYLQVAGFSEEQYGPMARIIHCESSSNPFAVGPGGYSIGLAQINTRAHKKVLYFLGIEPEGLMHPLMNLTVARFLYERYGYKPWAESNHCHHLLG